MKFSDLFGSQSTAKTMQATCRFHPTKARHPEALAEQCVQAPVSLADDDEDDDDDEEEDEQVAAVSMSTLPVYRILDSRLCSPGRDFPNRAQESPKRALRARGTLGFPQGVSTNVSPDWQTEVGDHFGRPQGAQVEALNFRR